MSRPLLLIFILAGLGLTTLPVAGQGVANRAGLVVRYADGRVETRCVAFSEPAISGEELLLRSGMTVIMNYNAGLGGAVCSINAAGCAYPQQDCFCQCQGKKCEYWAYYHGTGAGWQYSQVGASSYQVTNGALEGWSWGPGNFSSGTLPPPIGFSDICTPPTATPTATPTRTPSATPSSTATRPAGPASAPEVMLETSATRLPAGGCAVLKWATWNADRVTLDGAAVLAQDRLEVCPASSRRYVLAASNAAGQTAREVAVEVVAAAAAVVTNTPHPPREVAPPPAATATATPGPSPARATPDSSGDRPPAATPEPPRGLPPLAQAQEAAASPTPALAAPAEATATPRPPANPTSPARQAAAADRQSRPGPDAPTPILAGRVSSAPAAGSSLSPSGSGRAAGGGSAPRSSLPDRSFRLALLPGYATYLLMAGALAAAGVIVTRRRGY